MLSSCAVYVIKSAYNVSTLHCVGNEGSSDNNKDNTPKRPFTCIFEREPNRDFVKNLQSDPAFSYALKWTAYERDHNFLPLRWENTNNQEHFFPSPAFVGEIWVKDFSWGKLQGLYQNYFFPGKQETIAEFKVWLDAEMTAHELATKDFNFYIDVKVCFEHLNYNLKKFGETFLLETFDKKKKLIWKREPYLYFDVKEPFAFTPKLDLSKTVNTVFKLQRRAKHQLTVEKDLAGYNETMRQITDLREPLRHAWWELRIQEFLLQGDLKTGYWVEFNTGLKPEIMEVMERNYPALANRIYEWCREKRLEQFAKFEEYKKYYEEIAAANQVMTSAEEVAEFQKLLPENWDSEETSEPLWHLLGLSKEEMDALQPYDPDSYDWLEIAARNKAQNISDFVNSWKDLSNNFYGYEIIKLNHELNLASQKRESSEGVISKLTNILYSFIGKITEIVTTFIELYCEFLSSEEVTTCLLLYWSTNLTTL